MNKKSLLSFLFAITTLVSNAQLKDKIVGIIPFSAEEKKYESGRKELQSAVTDAFSSKKYIRLLDRSKVDQIKKELDRQKDIEYLDGKTVAQGKATGAEIIIVGELNSITTEKMSIGGVNTSSVKGIITFTLQAYDVSTGELLDNENFEASAAGNFSIDGVYAKENEDAGAVVRHAKEDIGRKVTKWIDEICPPKMAIIAIEGTGEKKDPYKLLVIGGKEANIRDNAVIDVKEISYLQTGERTLTRKVSIAKLRVDELQDDITQCKIIEGDEVLLEKHKTKPESLELTIDHNYKPSLKFPGKR